MGRRSQHAPEILRRMIVDAAEAIMEQGGLAALSAREVAKKIGYSPGTIYNMFNNLDDVIVMVEARVLDRMMERLSAVDERKRDDKLSALARAYLDFTHEHPHLWNVLFEHRLPEGRELPTWYLAKLADMLGLVEDALSPYFADDDDKARQRAARVLWSSVQGITALSTSGKLGIVTQEDAGRLVQNLVQVYIDGLKAAARSAKKAK